MSENTANLDLTSVEGVKSLMATSKSSDEWNKNRDAIKKANGYQYPTFWFNEIVVSGFGDKIAAKFGRDMSVKTAEVSL